MGPSDRATLVAGPAFDASVWEVWPYLTAGASLHIPDEEVRSTPVSLVGWLAERRITHCFLPTPLAEAVLLEPWPSGHALRSLLTGGDRLHRGPRAGAGFALFNHYGPTEASVVATWAAVESAESGSPPAIGRPIDNTRVYLLDRSGRAVPIAVAGELCLAGDGLARGYLARPELTAELFVPSPFGGPGARLYRTGDLARWSFAGQLEFLGRIDGQVKVRGFRIELGEIETVLGGHPAVREVVVTAREERSGDRRLVAYVVPRQAGQAVNDLSALLRAHVAQQLPGHFVPSACIVLASLPLTPNGKVDRGALPAPEWVGEVTYVAPQTPVEAMLAGIWSAVLAVERIGLDDDFFTLGGHSLLATQVISRVRETFGVELPLRSLFETPTVAGLALGIEAALAGSGRATPPPSRAIERSGPLPLSFAQERLWFFDQLDPGSAAYNIPVAVRLSGALDSAVLAASLAEIVRRHETLRTSSRAWKIVRHR